MPRYSPFDTTALDDFIQFYKDKHNPNLHVDSYAKFLELNITVLEDTRAEFESLFVGDIPQEEER